MARIKVHHAGPWEVVHDHAFKPDSYEYPSKNPTCLWFHKPVPFGDKMVDRLLGVTINRASRKWIAITVGEERLWLRKREVRCIRFDHPPKRPAFSQQFEDALEAGRRLQLKRKAEGKK